MCYHCLCVSCFFNDTATTEIYTYRHPLSLHDALPILNAADKVAGLPKGGPFIDVEVEQRPAISKRVPLAYPQPGMCRVEVGVLPIGIVADREEIGRAHV